MVGFGGFRVLGSAGLGLLGSGLGWKPTCA